MQRRSYFFVISTFTIGCQDTRSVGHARVDFSGYARASWKNWIAIFRALPIKLRATRSRRRLELERTRSCQSYIQSLPVDGVHAAWMTWFLRIYPRWWSMRMTLTETGLHRDSGDDRREKCRGATRYKDTTVSNANVLVTFAAST